MSGRRNIIYGTICLAVLCAACPVSLTILSPAHPLDTRYLAETMSAFGLFAWFPVLSGVLGLVFCTILCFIPATTRKLPALAALTPPLVGLISTGVGWWMETGRVLVQGKELLAGTDGLSDESISVFSHAMGVAHRATVLDLLWTAFSFLGVLLLARRAHQPDEPPSSLRWVARALGFGGASLVLLVIGLQESGPAVLGTRLSVLLWVALLVLLLGSWVLVPGSSRESSRNEALAVSGLIGAVVCLATAARMLPIAVYLISLREGPVLPFTAPPILAVISGMRVAFLPLVLASVTVALVSMGRSLARPGRWSIPALATALSFAMAWIPCYASHRGLETFLQERDPEGCTWLSIQIPIAMGERPPPPEKLRSLLASTPVLIEEGAELSLPSVASGPLTRRAVTVTITTAAILVDDVKVVGLREGRIDQANKGQGQQDYLIEPLREILDEAMNKEMALQQRNPEAARSLGRLVLAVDRGTDRRLLDEVRYTAMRAGFTRHEFIVRTPGHSCPQYGSVRLPPLDTIAPDTVSPAPWTLTVKADGYILETPSGRKFTTNDPKKLWKAIDDELGSATEIPPLIVHTSPQVPFTAELRFWAVGPSISGRRFATAIPMALVPLLSPQVEATNDTP